MRIQLDTQELSAIIINWGKEKYKTHNVSVEDLNSSGAAVMVTIPVDEFGSATTKLAGESYGNYGKLMQSVVAKKEKESVPYSTPHVGGFFDEENQLVLDFPHDKPSELL